MRSRTSAVILCAVLLSFALILFLALPASAAVTSGWERTHLEEPEPKRQTYKVKPGDTLVKIASKVDSPGPWTRLAYVNRSKFDDPDIIEVGTKLVIPAKDGKRLKYTPPRPEPKASRSSNSSQQYSSSSVSQSSPSSSTSGSTASRGSEVWAALARCESGMTNANTGNGYYGYFQFLPSTWRSVGGTGLPTDHGYGEQVKRAQILQARSGWGQWPAYSSKLGLR